MSNTAIVATIYCLSGSSLTYANKALSTGGHRVNPFLALFLQNSMTVLLVVLLGRYRPEKTGPLELPNDRKILCRFLVLVVLFFGMLISSLLALTYVSVSCLIVERNLVSLFVALLEYIVFGNAMKRDCIFALCGILAGAVYYGAADLDFDFLGYSWLLANVLCTSAFQIYNKKMLVDIKLSSFQFAYLNNLFSLVPCVLGCVWSWQTLDIGETFQPGPRLVWLGLSTLLGFCLSVSAFALSRAVTATTMMVVNNANKFFLIILMQLVGNESLSRASMIGTITALIYAGIYSHLKRQKETKIDATSKPMLRSLLLLLPIMGMMVFSSFSLLGQDLTENLAVFHIRNMTKNPTLMYKAIYSKQSLSLPPSRLLKGFTVWSSDWHIGPIADFKYFATKLFQMKVIDQSLSGHCKLKGTCAKTLKFLKRSHFGHLSPCERKNFFDAYKSDHVFKTVDFVFCSFPMAICQAYMPFNKTLIVQSTVRYEAGRETTGAFKRWLYDTKLMMDAGHIVVANNVYDSEYIRYFTGKKVPVLQTFAAYVEASYSPSRTEILIGPRGTKLGSIFNELQRVKQKMSSKLTFIYVKSLYPKFRYANLASHPAICIWPYAVSTISMFEYYRMNIPLLVPSVDLLYKWHKKTNFFKERTWPGTRGRPVRVSLIPRHEDAGDIPFDPNNEFDEKAWKYWVSLSDFYVWPYITRFDSLEDLINKLTSMPFREISFNMSVYNVQLRNKQLAQWRNLLKPAAERYRPGTRTIPSMNYLDAMRILYGELPQTGGCK